MIEVLYEDNHLIVVKKPPNVLTQSNESSDKNMLDLVKQYVKEKYNKPGDVYIGMIHRLDRPVGGVLVFARTSKAASRLSKQVQNRSVEKTYYCIVEGNVKDKKGKIIDYMIKDRNANMSSIVNENTQGAKKAILNYEKCSIAKSGNHIYTLLKIKLETGRPHQIRLQLSNMGYPIWGDSKYGRVKDRSTKALALWSYRMKINHPTKKEDIVFETLPDLEVRPWSLFSKII